MLILSDVHMQMFVQSFSRKCAGTQSNHRRCSLKAAAITFIDIADRSYLTVCLILSIRHGLRGIANDHYCHKQLVIWTGKADRAYHECRFGRCEEYNALLISINQNQESLRDTWIIYLIYQI